MYDFITNKHVKIWIGPLKLQNELRLRNLRTINPDCELYLIYDRRLLSTSEDWFIQNLCKDLNIMLFDVLADIVPQCVATEELNLIDDYNEAIQSIEQGGNPAAASDILRWLSPIYKLGIYSDMDVFIDVNSLPKSIKVSKPLLFNLGSLKIFDTDSPAINNDILAVVNSSHALPQIQKIQETIHNGCRLYRMGEDPFSYLQELYSSLPYHPDTSILTYFLSGSLPFHSELPSLAEGKSIGQTRAEIIRITNNSASFHEYSPWKSLFYKILSLGSDSSLNKIIKTYRMVLLKDSVIYTSGPGATYVALNEYPHYPGDYYRKEKVPHSFEHYGLDKHFLTGNRVPLHSSYIDLIKLYSAHHNDLSWLQEGRNRIDEHEAIISKISTRITASLSNTNLISNCEPCFPAKAIPPQITTELGKLAQLHMKQLAELQHQFRMNTACIEERNITFASCSKVSDALICVQTQVNFQSSSFFSTSQTFPRDLEYSCSSLSNGEPSLVCSTHFSQELCDIDSVSDSSPNLVSTLTTAATYSALAAAIPEAVGDALKLICHISEHQANYATQATFLIFIALTGSWLFLVVGMVGQSVGERVGLSKSSARLFGNTVAHSVNIAQNLAPSSLLTIGVGLAAGKFGLWAEKKIAKQFEGLQTKGTLSIN
ncbi:hypothetical protein ELY21_03360 [Legionella sp. km535]|uniref:glycosyltransferase family 88 protein n=1 Tax=Legionella sp. km535 TaxID=2498107 RepID=UPI000F8E50E4|nr:glycosyltransferase family 88 protein [Legionella sp. km535]RUR19649.1 hypothetical protein ELY21_03360 [Legionella sp. km535]